MTHYPLLFGFRDLVAGKGFLAGIAVHGRALLVHDADLGYWMYGVNPSGLSAGGNDIGEAHRAFREAYKAVLFDIAADAGSYDAFEAEVQRFFRQPSGFLSEWEEAVSDVRAGKVEADWVPRVDSGRAKLEIEVSLLSAENLMPSLNELDEQPALAAAVGF
jgi:hypothetical protein